jgi:hypothetical protein
VVQDLQILSFVQEELIRVLLRTHNARTGIGHGHLLRDLVGSWKGALSARTEVRLAQEEIHTIVAAKDKVVDGLQAEQSQEVPGQTRHPSDV